MEIEILSLFPSYFKSPLSESMLKRAIEKKCLKIHLRDIRSFADNKYQQVDDRPFGGGPGMVLMPEPTTKAIRAHKKEGSTVVYLSPQGKPLSNSLAKELAQKEHLVLLCGHYEGVDQRVIDNEVDLEISIGDYVLTNGCLAALVVLDALSRFIPGVLGHELSTEQDSFEKGLLDCCHYTRPQVFEEKSVPEVLLSGHHEEIKAWREQNAYEQTLRKRPDLIKNMRRQ